jgi:hypothetical protein
MRPEQHSEEIAKLNQRYHPCESGGPEVLENAGFQLLLE